MYFLSMSFFFIILFCIFWETRSAEVKEKSTGLIWSDIDSLSELVCIQLFQRSILVEVAVFYLTLDLFLQHLVVFLLAVNPRAINAVQYLQKVACPSD